MAWQWFVHLSRTRSSNGYSPNPISYAEIEAYARLYRWPLEPRHVDMILAMDQVWLDHMRSEAGAPTNSEGTNAPCREMNPAAFDAVFG